MTTPSDPRPASHEAAASEGDARYAEPHPRINDDSILGSAHPTRAMDAAAERKQQAPVPTTAPGDEPQDSTHLTTERSQGTPAKIKKTFASSTWAALIVGALLLILLLVFIMQNQQPVELTLFAWNFEFPAGVGFLLAAIVGALIMALVGVVRMVELRRQVKKAGRA